MNANDDDDNNNNNSQNEEFSPHDVRRERERDETTHNQSKNTNTTTNPPVVTTTTTTTKVKSKTSCSGGYKYKAMIAPVKVINCPTIKFGKQYFCRVTRLKDKIEYATPIVKCEMPGTLDFSKFRRSDNRGPQRPPFITPLSVQFETIKDKRTVTIYIEEYCEFYKHNGGAATRLAPGAILPLSGDADEDDENRKIAATAHFDLITFVNVFENETKGLTNFPIEVHPTETASEDVTLKFFGGRSVVEVDILMHPARLVEPMWPSPNEKEQNFHKLLARSTLNILNNNNLNGEEFVNNNPQGASSSAGNNNNVKQRSAAAKRKLAIAEHAILRAKMKKGNDGNDDEDENEKSSSSSSQGGNHDDDDDDNVKGAVAASSSGNPMALRKLTKRGNSSNENNGANFSFGGVASRNPLGDAQNKKRQKFSVLTPEMQRQIQDVLDQLNQIQNLRTTVMELESEVIELEERRDNMVMAATMNSSSSREESSNRRRHHQSVTPDESGTKKNNYNQDTDEKEVESDPASFIITSQEEYEKIEDFISNLQQEIQMMVGDALSRWDLTSLAMMSSSTDFPDKNNASPTFDNNNINMSPKSESGTILGKGIFSPSSSSSASWESNEILRLLASENFVPVSTSSMMVPPNAALEKFVVGKNSTVSGPTISAHELFKNMDDDFTRSTTTTTEAKLKNEFLINEATQMCAETIEKYLKSVVETKGEIFPNFSLPNEDEIVQELLRKISSC